MGLEIQQMANDWYAQIMGETQGPLTSAQVKQLARIGQIATDTLLKRGENGTWVSADQVQGLFAPSARTNGHTPPAPPVQPPPHDRNGGSPKLPVAKESMPFVKPKVASTRRRKQGGLFAGIVYAIDPMFERYLTPWIIRCTWGLVLLAAVLAMGFFVFVDGLVLANAQPDRSAVALAEMDVNEARALVHEIEEMRERWKRQASPSGRDYSRSEPYDSSESNSRPEVSKVDALDEAKTRLAIAEKRLADAIANAPTKWQAAMELAPGQALLLALQSIACILAVLWLRVLLESGIVLFNIVTKLGSIDDRLAVMNRRETAGPAQPPAEPVASTA